MVINTEGKGKKHIPEAIKWIIVSILLIIVVISNYFYQRMMFPIGKLIIVVLLAAASSVALLTKKGKAIISFSREARIEMRNIIWPSRKETFHITLIVLLATSVISLILWGLDNILIFLVALITGLRF